MKKLTKIIDTGIIIYGWFLLISGALVWTFWSDTLEDNFTAFTALVFGVLIIWANETRKYRDRIAVLEAKVSNIQDHTVKLLNMNGIVYVEYHGRAYDKDGYPVEDPGTGEEVMVSTDRPE